LTPKKTGGSIHKQRLVNWAIDTTEGSSSKGEGYWINFQLPGEKSWVAAGNIGTWQLACGQEPKEAPGFGGEGKGHLPLPDEPPVGQTSLRSAAGSYVWNGRA